MKHLFSAESGMHQGYSYIVGKTLEIAVVSGKIFHVHRYFQKIHAGPVHSYKNSGIKIHASAYLTGIHDLSSEFR